MDAVVLDEAGWAEDGSQAPLESRVSRRWRSQRVRTLFDGLDLPCPLDAATVLRFMPELGGKRSLLFMEDVGLAKAGGLVTQERWRRILPVFWRLPAWGWPLFVQSAPPGVQYFLSAWNRGPLVFVYLTVGGAEPVTITLEPSGKDAA